VSRTVSWVWAAACLLAAGLVLVACGNNSALLSGVSANPATVRPTGRHPTEPIQLAYTLGRPATVTLHIQGGPTNVDLVLRPAEHLAAGTHFVLFDGVVPVAATPGATATPVARVLPDGSYRFTASVDDGGARQDSSAPFTIQDAQTTAPGLENLQVYPATISPNSDAIDDVAQITYRLAQTSTTSVTLQGAGGNTVTVLAPAEQPAGEQSVPFNGSDLLGKSVPAGPYTVTVRTADLAGNAVEARRPLTVTDAGQPNIALLSVKIEPPQLMLGGKLHVHMVVQNTGQVPLRTQGPDSGYTYTTNDSYSSIEGGRYTDQAGLWRVGLDWEGNAGGAPYRYPFRWGFGHTLAPGETATIDGYVTILKREQTMWFYAGVLQEGVRIALDGLGRTPISVSW
jgi:flagellar hook capping protein FlgD